ncbi:MAG: hypothetical protein NTV57_03750 [Cyanobacteria bacterium]|nr:hypothetical protein [Cyanobacteriota bacterium]
MPAPLLKLTLALTSAPVMVAVAFAWGSPAMARPAGLTAVPGPLPVLGALSAFGFSRKLRQRIIRTQANASRIG